MSFTLFVVRGYGRNDALPSRVLDDGEHLLQHGQHSIRVAVSGNCLTIFPKSFVGVSTTELDVALMDYEYGGDNSPKVLHLGPHVLDNLIFDYHYEGLISEIKLECGDGRRRVLLSLDDGDTELRLVWLPD